MVLPAHQTCFQQAVWSFSSEDRWSKRSAFFRNANACKNKYAAIHPNPVKMRQSWVLEIHLNKDTLCFKTCSSSFTPTSMSFSDLTVICQRSSASLLAVTDGASYIPLSVFSAHSRNLWKVLLLPHCWWKAPTFLQEILSLQGRPVNDRRPKADWKGQCLIVPVQGCTFRAVTLPGQSQWTRHMVTPFSATEFTDNFHPYCPVIWMNNGPSAVLECNGVLETPAATVPALLWADASCTFSVVGESLGAEAPSLG